MRRSEKRREKKRLFALSSFSTSFFFLNLFFAHPESVLCRARCLYFSVLFSCDKLGHAELSSSAIVGMRNDALQGHGDAWKGERKNEWRRRLSLPSVVDHHVYSLLQAKADHSSTGTALRPKALLHSGACNQTAAYSRCGNASAASVTASEGAPRLGFPAASDHMVFSFSF